MSVSRKLQVAMDGDKLRENQLRCMKFNGKICKMEGQLCDTPY